MCPFLNRRNKAKSKRTLFALRTRSTIAKLARATRRIDLAKLQSFKKGQIQPIRAYSDRLNLSLFEQTKQSQIEANFVRAPNEEHHCQIGKGDEEDRFGEVAVVQKGTNSTDLSIGHQMKTGKNAVTDASLERLSPTRTILIYADRGVD